MNPDNVMFTSVMEADYSSKEYDIKQAFFTNLLLLGFDAKSFEIKYRIPVNKDMFDLPNKNGSEAVLYFLFDQLNPIMCKEEFRCICGCPTSNKKDEQQFRRVCNNWLINIQKEEPESHLPRVSASLFMSPGGDKYYQLLLSFSNYVVKQVIKRDNGVKNFLGFPELTHKTIQLDDSICKTVQCASIRHRRGYFQQLQQNLNINNEWKEYSRELVKEYRHSTKKIRDLERHVISENQKSVERSQERGSPVSFRRKSAICEFDLDGHSVHRTQRITKLRDMWKQVEKFQTSDSKDREIVESILEKTLNKEKQLTPGISATDLNIKIPDLLLRECETEIHRRHVDNTYKGGKLNLLSVMQLWNLSLHLYQEHLQQVSSLEIESENAKVTTQLHTHNAHLTNAQNLREKLSEDLLPQLKQSINTLRSELDCVTILPQHRTPNATRITSLGFELSAPTPPLSFTPKDDGGNLAKHSILQYTPTQGVSTPEAANQILDNVLQTSRKTATKYHQGSPVYIPTINSGIPVTNRNTNNSKLSKHVSLKDRLPSKLDVGIKPVNSLVKTSKTESGESTVKHSTPIRKEPHIRRTTPKPYSTPQSAQLKSSPHSSTNAHIVVQQYHNTPAKICVPKAHDLLVDKIVSAVIDGSPNQDSSHQQKLDVNLLNPLAALDESVFVSRDKIGRSPDVMAVEENNNDKGVESPDEIRSRLPFHMDSTRLKLSFNEDNSLTEATSFCDENMDQNKSALIVNRNTLIITEDNDSGLLTINSDSEQRGDTETFKNSFFHQEQHTDKHLNSSWTSNKVSVSSNQHLNLSKEDLMNANNPIRDSLVHLESCSLEAEIPNLVLSPNFGESQSVKAKTVNSRELSELFGELGLASVDAELDDIFNTKTPKIIRKMRNYDSLDSATDSEDVLIKFSTPNVQKLDSLTDEQPVTLVSFSPPSQPGSFLNPFTDHSRNINSRTVFESSFHQNSESGHTDTSCVSSLTDTTVVQANRLDPFSEIHTSDLIDNEEFPDMLELNDSFVPLKEGVQLTGSSPGKLVKLNSSRLSVTSVDDIEHCRRLRKATSDRLIQIDDAIARTNRSIHEAEQQLLSTTSEEINMSDQSQKHLTPEHVNGDRIHTSLFSSLTNTDLNEDIFAEDDTLLLPISPSNY